MDADQFAALVKTLREMGAAKVRVGDFECVFATPYVAPEAKVKPPAAPEPAPPVQPSKQRPTKLRSDVETEEQRRLAQLREELEN
jgi:hypothetical protein